MWAFQSYGAGCSIALSVSRQDLFPAAQVIDQLPAFRGSELSLEGGHAAETESDGLVDVRVATLPHQLVVQNWWRWRELVADRTGFVLGNAVAHGTVDSKERLSPG